MAMTLGKGNVLDGVGLTYRNAISVPRGLCHGYSLARISIPAFDFERS
jgi:hypothetical protein